MIVISLKQNFEASLIRTKSLDAAVIYALGLTGTDAATTFKDHVQRYIKTTETSETAKPHDHLSYHSKEWMPGHESSKLIQNMARDIYMAMDGPAIAHTAAVSMLENDFSAQVKELENTDDQIFLCYVAFEALAENERRKNGIQLETCPFEDALDLDSNDIF